MNMLNLKRALASAIITGITATSALAADITMNVGFGAPEESLYGRFGKIFEEKAEDYTNGTVDVKLRCCNQIMSIPIVQFPPRRVYCTCIPKRLCCT